MNNFEDVFKAYKLHKLIKQGFSGSINEYARKLRVSRGCLYENKEILERLGAEIKYSRALNKFIYLNDFEFKVELKFTPIKEKEMKKIYGGMKKFIPSIFLYGRNLSLPLINKL